MGHPSDRSSRRAQRARVINNRSHYWGRDLRGNPRCLGMVSKTTQPCGFPSGNPSRYGDMHISVQSMNEFFKLMKSTDALQS